ARVGGDFMSGRFFALPLLASATIIVYCLRESSKLTIFGSIAAILLFSLSSPRPPLLSDSNFGKLDERRIRTSGIADERGFYFQTTGLLQSDRLEATISHKWAENGRLDALKNQPLYQTGYIGFYGFFVGPQTYVMDFHGLSDPLLSRLPAANRHSDWRSGHFERTFPAGYIATRESGFNQIVDSSLALYFDKLSIITEGSLGSFSRLAEIFKMNFGFYNHLLDAYAFPEPIRVSYSKINVPVERNRPSDDDGNFFINWGGIEIALDSVCYASELQLSVDNNDKYDLLFMRDGAIVGRYRINSKLAKGLRIDNIRIPENIWRIGYDKLAIIPIKGDDFFSVGHVKLRE
ncbi:MAG: hypothetical protein V3T31_13285, partial [candidate division Zixibacteria bacterium]